tara:strand:+ start:11590 stop:11805 length:216 start_codon:yes stop_codon:yes gene_type:complete
MNKYIELVKKWLDDKDSVTVKELRKNAEDAYHASASAYAYDVAAVYAYDAAYAAAYDAAYWVKRYEELTGE